MMIYLSLKKHTGEKKQMNYSTVRESSVKTHLLPISKCLVKGHTVFVLPYCLTWVVLNGTDLLRLHGSVSVCMYLKGLNNNTLDNIEWYKPTTREVKNFLSIVGSSEFNTCVSFRLPNTWELLDYANKGDNTFMIRYQICTGECKGTIVEKTADLTNIYISLQNSAKIYK